MSEAVVSELEVVEPTEVIENREQPRFPCTLASVCRPSSHAFSEGNWPARVEDISASGVRLLLNRRFEVGTSLILQVGDPAGHSCTMLARVVWVAGPRPGHWLLGCSLSQGLSNEELRGLVQYPYRDWIGDSASTGKTTHVALRRVA